MNALPPIVTSRVNSETPLRTMLMFEIAAPMLIEHDRLARIERVVGLEAVLARERGDVDDLRRSGGVAHDLDVVGDDLLLRGDQQAARSGRSRSPGW